MLDLSRDSNNPMNVKTRVRLGLKQSRFCGPYVHDPFKIFARVGHVCICMRARARVLCTSYIEILLCSSFEIERNLELLINDESHRLTYIFNFFDFKEKKIIIDRKKVIFFYIYIYFFLRIRTTIIISFYVSPTWDRFAFAYHLVYWPSLISFLVRSALPLVARATMFVKPIPKRKSL